MKKNQSKNPKSKKRNILIILALAVVLSAAGYFAHDAYLDYQDKQRFETVRRSVEGLHTKLQEAAGPGEEWAMSASCSQGSVKFQEALKSCTLDIETRQNISSGQEALKLIEKYQTLLKGSPEYFSYKGEGLLAVPSNFPEDLMQGYDGSSFSEINTEMNCSSLFEIKDFIIKDREESELIMSFTCRERARELHYPRSDI